jgi:hypothetical protein
MLKKRYIKVYVGSSPQLIFEYHQRPTFMRIDFEVKKYSNIYAYGLETASIELSNIKDDKVRNLMLRDNPVILEAGYEGEGNIIFNGRIGTAFRIKKNADDTNVITNLLCSSGSMVTKFYTHSQTITKMSIKSFLINLCKNIYIFDGTIEKNANITPEFIKDLNGNDLSGTIINQTFDGNIINILHSLSIKFKFDFQIGENKILFRPIQEKPILDITPSSGLIGIPEITEKGIDFKIFLNPNLQCGDCFNLTSRYSNFRLGALNFLDRLKTGANFNSRTVNNENRYFGTYKILNLIHKGSSHTDDWQTEIESQNYILNTQTLREQSNK